MAVIALGAGHCEPEHLQHPGISLVEIEGDDIGIPIDAQCKLRQSLEPIENPSNNCAKASIRMTLFGISHIT